MAYGIKRVPSKAFNAEEVINFIHEQGGIAVCAHPYSNRHNAFGDKVYNYKFDAIELNGAIGKKSNKLGEKAAIIMDLPTIGGSDAHSKSQLNTKVTKLNSNITSIAAIIKAVKNKECKAINL
ncbi:MAG: PHP-associated domain-containing protein [Candidatus Lokiarchaeota archaeon]